MRRAGCVILHRRLVDVVADDGAHTSATDVTRRVRRRGVRRAHDLSLKAVVRALSVSSEFDDAALGRHRDGVGLIADIELQEDGLEIRLDRFLGQSELRPWCDCHPTWRFGHHRREHQRVDQLLVHRHAFHAAGIDDWSRRPRRMGKPAHLRDLRALKVRRAARAMGASTRCQRF